MVRMDPKICTVMDMTDGLFLIFGYFTGLLPYFAFDRDLAAFPYMTNDFRKMKYEERRLSQTLGKKCFFTFYIHLMSLMTMFWNPIFLHL